MTFHTQTIYLFIEMHDKAVRTKKNEKQEKEKEGDEQGTSHLAAVRETTWLSGVVHRREQRRCTAAVVVRRVSGGRLHQGERAAHRVRCAC